VLVLAIIGIVAWAVRTWFFTATGGPVEITMPVSRASLSIVVTERGELESSETVDARCEVEGAQNKIVTILPEGTRVKKGDVVVTFDADQLNRTYADQEVKWKTAEGKAKADKGELEVQKNKAEGEIAKADLDLKLAVLDRDKYIQGEYKKDLDKLNGEIELAKKEWEEAKDKLEHFRPFVKKGFGTPEQLTVKELDVAQKEFLLSSKRAELLVLEKFTRRRQEEELKAKAEDAERNLARAKSSGAAAIAKAQSDLEAAEVTARLEKTTLDRIKRQLDRCTVRAPADGILVYSKDRWWDASSRVQPGAMVHYQQALFSLPDLAQMQAKVKIHEAMVKKLKVGQKAEVRVEAYPDKVLHGTVKSVATLANSEGWFGERGVKEYITIVKVDDLPDGAGIKPGMTAEVKILVNELPDVLTVPVQAVSESEGKHCAYVIGPKGAERREVEVGDNNEKFVEIKAGLKEAERVALDARARSAAEAKAREQREGAPAPKPGTVTPATAKVSEPAKPVTAPVAAAPVAVKPSK
jgi:RND family efflux transporter MFP subunit